MNFALHAVSNTVSGAQVLAEWLGAGGTPVSQYLADSRAQICLDCPRHRPGEWWDAHKDAIANTIRKHIEVKNQCNLTVFNEHKTGMCKQCGCAVRLKAWCPIEHIKNHTRDISEYPETCWIRRESQ